MGQDDDDVNSNDTTFLKIWTKFGTCYNIYVGQIEKKCTFIIYSDASSIDHT